MKFFDPKQKKEPEAFRTWKRQELSQLIALCKKGKGRALFEHLNPSPPRQREEGICYFSKQELVEALLEEQGFLCCYCNRSFDLQAEIEAQAEFPVEIEHLAPVKNYPERALDYTNLMASCNGGRMGRGNLSSEEKRKREKDLTCNAARESNPLQMTPQQRDCEMRIIYGENGAVFGADEEASATIDLLNLKKFDRSRGKILEGWIYTNTHHLIGKTEAEQILQKLHQKQNGKYVAYCSAIIQVIQREILQ